MQKKDFKMQWISGPINALALFQVKKNSSVNQKTRNSLLVVIKSIKNFIFVFLPSSSSSSSWLSIPSRWTFKWINVPERKKLLWKLKQITESKVGTSSIWKRRIFLIYIKSPCIHLSGKEDFNGAFFFCCFELRNKKITENISVE